MIRQAALAKLSPPRCQRINLRIAHAIERVYAGRLEDKIHDLTHHLWQAGSAADPKKTIDYLLMAASQARTQSAYQAAITYFQNALKLLKGLPANGDRDRKELDMYLQYLDVLSFTNRFTTTEAGIAHARARELCERLGQTSAMYALLEGAAGFHLRRGDHHESNDIARRILELSESSTRPEWAVSAHYLIGHTLCCIGSLAPAHEHLTEAASVGEAMPLTSIGGITAKVCALGVDAVVLWTSGYADRSLARVDEAIAFSEESKNPYDLAIALIYAHIVTLARRDFARALEFADRGLRIAAEKQFEWLQTALAWSRDACRVLAGLDKEISKTKSAFRSTSVLKRSCTSQTIAQFLPNVVEFYDNPR